MWPDWLWSMSNNEFIIVVWHDSRFVSHVCVWHYSFIMQWPIHMCVIHNESYQGVTCEWVMWHDSRFVALSYVCDMILYEVIMHQYSPFPRRWDSKCSLKCKSKSMMVNVQVLFQISHLKKDLWIPSRILFCIPITISSLIFSGTGCTTDQFLRFHKNEFDEMLCKISQ